MHVGVYVSKCMCVTEDGHMSITEPEELPPLGDLASFPLTSDWEMILFSLSPVIWGSSSPPSHQSLVTFFYLLFVLVFYRPYLPPLPLTTPLLTCARVVEVCKGQRMHMPCVCTYHLYVHYIYTHICMSSIDMSNNDGDQ